MQPSERPPSQASAGSTVQYSGTVAGGSRSASPVSLRGVGGGHVPHAHSVPQRLDWQQSLTQGQGPGVHRSGSLPHSISSDVVLQQHGAPALGHGQAAIHHLQPLPPSALSSRGAALAGPISSPGTASLPPAPMPAGMHIPNTGPHMHTHTFSVPAGDAVLHVLLESSSTGMPGGIGNIGYEAVDGMSQEHLSGSVGADGEELGFDGYEMQVRSHGGAGSKGGGRGKAARAAVSNGSMERLARARQAMEQNVTAQTLQGELFQR